jgi:tetratricopeptide (TPR) repeat protein
MRKLYNWILTFLMGALLPVFFCACTKEVPKEMLNTNKQTNPPGSQNQQMPNDSIHKNLSPHGDKQQEQSGSMNYAEDSAMVVKLTVEADNADARYEKSKSDSDKKATVEKQMAAANYLMFQAESLTPKKKYRPALKRYKRVLELDPSNKEAAANKKQIEDIYQQMGMPIPND